MDCHCRMKSSISIDVLLVCFIEGFLQGLLVLFMILLNFNYFLPLVFRDGFFLTHLRHDLLHMYVL